VPAGIQNSFETPTRALPEKVIPEEGAGSLGGGGV